LNACLSSKLQLLSVSIPMSLKNNLAIILPVLYFYLRLPTLGSKFD